MEENMLILTCRLGESLKIGDEISIKVTSLRSTVVRIGVLAPTHVTVLRKEVYKRQTLHEHTPNSHHAVDSAMAATVGKLPDG